MRNLKYIVFFFTVFMCIMKANAQYTPLDTMELVKPEFIKINSKKLARKQGKDFTNQYKNYLFMPHVYLKNINLTPKLFFSDTKVVQDTIYASIKKNPTLENIVLGDDYMKNVYIYNDSLRFYEVRKDSYLYGVSIKKQNLLKFYLKLNADLLFHIWGLGLSEYFVLMNNKIYMLNYDKETQSYKLTGF